MEMPGAERTAPVGTAQPVGVAKPKVMGGVRVPLGLRCLECGRSLFHRFSRERPCFRCEAARAQAIEDVRAGVLRRKGRKTPVQRDCVGPLGVGLGGNQKAGVDDT